MKRSFLAAITIAGVVVTSAAAVLGAGCGSKAPHTTTGGAGQPGGPDAGDGSAWGGGAPDSNASGTEDGPTSGPASMPTSMPAQPEGFYFDLQNAGTGELVFPVDKGWQTAIFAYTGKPPKAKSVLLFPTACSASCDVRTTDPEAEVCPVCKVEEDHKKRKQQERDETKREIAPPGGSVMVPWDGQVFVYEKTKDGKRKCKCWRKAPTPPDTYTIKACGMRPSIVAGVPSTPQCAETSVALPLPPEQRSLPLLFPEPPAPKKKK